MLPRSIQALLASIVPFVVMGAMLAFTIVIFVFFFYLFLWGLVIGLVLYAINAVIRRFKPSLNPVQRSSRQESIGEVYDHREND